MTKQFLDALCGFRISKAYSEKIFPHMPYNREGIEIYFEESGPGRKAALTQVVEAYHLLLGPNRVPVDGFTWNDIQNLTYQEFMALRSSVLRSDLPAEALVAVKSASRLEEDDTVSQTYAEYLKVLLVGKEKLSDFEDWLVDIRKEYDEELGRAVASGMCSRCAASKMYRKYAKKIDEQASLRITATTA